MKPPAGFLSNKSETLSLHFKAIAWNKRPSEILGVKNEWLAYQFDEAVFRYGRWVENKLAEVDKKGKPKYTIDDVINNNARPPSLFALMANFGADGDFDLKM